MNLKEITRNLRSTSNRWKIYLLVGVIVYFVIINQILHVRPDHAFLALFLLTFLLGKERANRYLIDWLPFIVFWILYDMMRGLVDAWRGEINIILPYKIELSLFGWMFGGEIPNFWFQDWQVRHADSIFKGILDLMSANFYTLHFALPLVFGWILWHTIGDRKFYYRFVYTFTVLNMLALITFFLYPVAPPWYVMKYGFTQPIGKLYGAAGSLLNVDNMLRMKFFTTLWDNMNPNHFAAVPSLHGAYPVVIVFFAYLRIKKRLFLMSLYPIGTWFAAVYLNHHYIIDLIIGAFYIVIAFYIEEKILMPKIFEKTIFKNNEVQRT